MAKVMSPQAPLNEAAGMKAAQLYYSRVYLDATGKEIIESAERVCKAHETQYEWCNGFMRAAVEIAAKRQE